MPAILVWILRLGTLAATAFVAWNAKEVVSDIFNPVVTVENANALNKKRLITFAGLAILGLIYLKSKR